MGTINAKNNIPGIVPVKTNTSAVRTASVSERQRARKQIQRSLGIRRATEKWESKKAARIAAEKARDDFYNTDVDQIDFITMGENASEDAGKKYKALCVAAENAKTAEKQARRELWSAKYDTMSDSELQAAVVDIEDETEKGYVTTLQGKVLISPPLGLSVESPLQGANQN